jgi:hypothetical protein
MYYFYYIRQRRPVYISLPYTNFYILVHHNETPSAYRKNQKKQVSLSTETRSSMSTRPYKKRIRHTRVDSERPYLARKQTCSHTCEVTLDRLFLEKQAWVEVADYLQEQIDVLHSWRPSESSAVVEPPTTKPTCLSGSASDTDTRKMPDMPSDHPLYQFVGECLAQTEWDSRARCGAVKKRYDEWCGQQNNEGFSKLNHVRFSREMKKYWKKKGSQARAYYVGIELVVKDSEEPNTPIID